MNWKLWTTHSVCDDCRIGCSGFWKSSVNWSSARPSDNLLCRDYWKFHILFSLSSCILSVSQRETGFFVAVRFGTVLWRYDDGDHDKIAYRACLLHLALCRCVISGTYGTVLFDTATVRDKCISLFSTSSSIWHGAAAGSLLSDRLSVVATLLMSRRRWIFRVQIMWDKLLGSNNYAQLGRAP